MRPVDQTSYGIRDGDCFRACIASILELPIEVVPNFALWDNAWLDVFASWLAELGLSATMHHAWAGAPAPLGFSIAGGPSMRFAGRMHSCVALDGVVVHDPHPSRDGLPSGVASYVEIHAP